VSVDPPLKADPKYDRALKKGQCSSPHQDGGRTAPAFRGPFFGIIAGTRFDVLSIGRVGINGVRNSGRRWHRRISSKFHRFGAATF
jgi:hypothetical protein